MQNNYPNEKNNNLSNNNPKDEISKKHEESIKIFELMKKPNYFFKYYKEFTSFQSNNISKNSGNQYYLIYSNWINKFKDFCDSLDYYYEYEYPDKIDNKIIFIQDDSTLKAENDNKIYYNNKFLGQLTVSVVIKEIWIKLKEIFGGGPEYEIIYQPDKKTNLIFKGVRINLLFIKNKIKNFEERYNIEDIIHIKHIYLDINENVLYLKKYINDILNKYKDEFFTKNNNESIINNLIEDIHYRLWLYSTFYGTPEVIAEFIKERIKDLKKNNLLYDSNNLINWNNFGNISTYKFQIIPLLFFEKNIIKDIFPNRNNTQYFDYKNEFENLKNEENNSLPFFTIFIEEAPFSLIKEDIIYRLGSCAKCHYSQITYNACECNNCFFCLKSCENIYKERGRPNYTHFTKCKIHLMSLFIKENNQFYHNNKLKFSLTGLANLGNTCYMNSSLQCLRSIKELTKYFLNYFDEKQLNQNNIMGTEGFLAHAFANYIYKMNQGDKNFLELKSFKYAIGIVDDRFSGTDQQDAHEFLTFLIDSIHEDLNKVIVRPIVLRKNSDWEKNFSSSLLLDKLKSTIEWNNFLKRNQSIMVDLFYGQYKTTISCPKCLHDSTNFSSFLSLQLPIPLCNNFFSIKVFLYEEWLNIKPYIQFEIMLNKNNNKILIVKKIIGKIFNISPYQIEIFKPMKSEISKVYNNDEELTPNIMQVKAVKINLKTIKGIDNLFEQNIIYHENLEKNVRNRLDEYISYIKNLDNNNNNNDDDCDIIIDINDDNVENISKINYEDYSLQKFIIKHYTYNLYKQTISNNLIHKDYLIYTKIEQTCYDLYFQFFFVYFPFVIRKQSELTKIEDFEELEQHIDQIKIDFDKLFKNYLEEGNKIREDIFSEHPDLPFFLKIKLYKSKVSKIIPNSKKRKFKKFLNQLVKNENKNYEIKSKSLEDQEEEKTISIEINNTSKKEMDTSMSDSNDNNLIKNKFYDYDPITSMQGPIIDLSGKNSSNSKKNIISKEKEKDKDKNKEKDIYNKNIDNNIVHSIMIIFNPKYLIKDNNGDFRLTNYILKKKDLTGLFKIAHQDIEKISIDKCFEEFTKIQTLDENNLYNCPKCKQNIAANNSIELYKIPNILIIQLKRFKNGQKIKTFIDFPIRNLDISPFISESSPYFSTTIKYDLFAVSNHYGELEYGHYDANCLNYIDNNWYNFNDKKVEIIEENNPEIVVTKNAYVLFYRQRKMDNKNWDYIYQKKYMDIKDDNYLDNINELKYNSLKNINGIIKTNIIELNEEEDEKELEQNSQSEEISLREFVYNPFKDSYLKMKRKLIRRSKKIYK